MMNVIFCIVAYSGGMPILYWLGFVYCFVVYWTDRISLLKYSRKPPRYSEQVMIFITSQLVQDAVFIHLLLTAWVYGNQLVFPSGESIFKPLIMGAIGLNET